MNRPVSSASNLFRRALCPGSERMEYGLPEEDSDQSREGSLLHDYAAHPEYDRSLLRPGLRDLLDRNDALVGEIGERIENVIGIPYASVLRETHLSNELTSGTPDFFAAYPTEDHALWLNDSKFGYRLVERAELNLQLRAYAMLVYDFTASKPQRIFVSITQPRLGYDERITLAEYKPEDIGASREEIAAIRKASSSDRAKLRAGEEQCRYCKAKLICPAFQKSLTVPVLALAPKQQLSKTAREAYLEQLLATITDKQLEKVLTACAFATMIKNPAHDEARKRIAAGQLEHYFLSEASSRRDIADPQKAIALLELCNVATREDILRICSLPLGQLEENYRKRTKCTWREAREKINRILGNVIETTEQKPRVLRKANNVV